LCQFYKPRIARSDRTAARYCNRQFPIPTVHSLQELFCRRRRDGRLPLFLEEVLDFADRTSPLVTQEAGMNRCEVSKGAPGFGIRAWIVDGHINPHSFRI